MRATGPERIGLAAAAVVLVAASVAAAVRNPSEPASTSAISPVTPEPSPTTRTEPSVTGAAPAPGAVRTAAPIASPAPGATTAPPRASAGRPGPPKLGTYEYTETDPEGTTTSTLEIASQGGGRHTEDRDDGSAVDEVLWRSDGKFDRATTFSFPNGSFRCDWEPDFLIYRFPLRAGSSWRIESSCRAGNQATINLSGTSRVTTQQPVTIDGTRVDTWLVVTDAKITFSGEGASFTQEIHNEDYFAPNYGITVREIATTTGTGPSGEESREKTTRVLKRLEPTAQA